MATLTEWLHVCKRRLARRPVVADVLQHASMAFTLTDARAYIAEARWQFARTMPQWPHEFTLRTWREDLDESFFAFVKLIRDDGIVKPWPRDAERPRYHHTYLEIDGWEYWTMGEPIAETALINRALVEEKSSGPEAEYAGTSALDKLA